MQTEDGVTKLCKNCKFSEDVPVPSEGKSFRICRLHPPTSHPIMMVGPKGPQTVGMTTIRAGLSDDEWCYQFQPDFVKSAGLVRPS